MEGNNIVNVLNAIGEKLTAMELELQCERYKNAEMEKQVVEKDQRLAEKDKIIHELQTLLNKEGITNLCSGYALVEGR